MPHTEYKFTVDGQTYQGNFGVIKALFEKKTISADTIVHDGSSEQTVSKILGLAPNRAVRGNVTAPVPQEPPPALPHPPPTAPPQLANGEARTVTPTLALSLGILGFVLSLAGFVGHETLKGLVIFLIALAMPASGLGLLLSFRAIGKIRNPARGGDRKLAASAIPTCLLGLVISGLLAIAWLGNDLPNELAARRARNHLNAQMVLHRIFQIQSEYQEKNPDGSFAQTLQEVAAKQPDDSYPIEADILTGKIAWSGYIVRGMRVWPKTKSTPARFRVLMSPIAPEGITKSGDFSFLLTETGQILESRAPNAFVTELKEPVEPGQTGASSDSNAKRNPNGNSGAKHN